MVGGNSGKGTGAGSVPKADSRKAGYGPSPAPLEGQVNPGHGIVQIVEPVAKKIEMRAEL